MSDDPRKDEERWARVHGEAGTPAAADADEDRQHEAEAKRLHGWLRIVAPWMNRSNEELEAMILKQWEAETSAAHATTTRPGASWLSLRVHQLARAAVFLVLFAAGAAAVYRFSELSGPDVMWADVVWVSPAGRGADTGEEAPIPSREQLELRLKSSVMDQLKSLKRPLHSLWAGHGWTLAVTLTPTDGDTVRIDIRAQAVRKGLPALQWSALASMDEDSPSALIPFGQKIRNDLDASRKNHP